MTSMCRSSMGTTGTSGYFGLGHGRDWTRPDEPDAATPHGARGSGHYEQS